MNMHPMTLPFPKLEHRLAQRELNFKSLVLVAPPSAVAWHFSDNFALLIVMTRERRKKMLYELNRDLRLRNRIEICRSDFFRFMSRYYCRFSCCTVCMVRHSSSAEIIVDWWIFHLNFFAPRHRCEKRLAKNRKLFFNAKWISSSGRRRGGMQ